MTVTDLPPRGGFVHPALFYASDEEYLRVLVPFLTDGLALGYPVAAAVPRERLALLREALGDAATDVLLIDMEVEGRNPGRIIPGVLRRFADGHPEGRVRIVGEPVWAGRSDVEYPACAQHEALINLAFAGRDVSIVCPYDTSALDERALTDALATHPEVWEASRRYDSGHYDPDDVVVRYNRVLDVPADAALLSVATTADLRGARRFATAEAERLGLSAERTAQVALVVTELVTNSLRHTGAGCRLAVWRDPDHVVCGVRDGGRLTDPLAGRRPAAPDQDGGRGLLVVNHLADLVRTHTSPDGTSVHAFLRLAD
ncbi:sensor histidine kinase [Saccharothrix longispora]|uniref:Anti-sigma regulatory factor (Ser/Thr protein kinase) n=1 Tax=Saccharothrix longispora TaxID=33920 RepID=A0ABU1PW14_9PSEU|nr:sensor histidine kinase [Saccharothrix longispora]MDR6594833.1 anti-sigma regulatory factor (Ser/Thr protein kinase) [Saccharothrix longispora]